MTRLLELLADAKSIDDRIMGGVSSSSVEYISGEVCFSGELSLKRGGGFASVRVLLSDGDLREATGLTLTFKGDGRRYQIRLGSRGVRSLESQIYYRYVFDTKPGERETLKIPFEKFEGAYRGQKRDAPLLIWDQIVSIGLLVSERQAGDFRLCIGSIDWY